ncbi:VOC family protein [Ferrovibrio sp.]|uniref:VOC family protein n=1 Tax=Ferrovibrio sp. TaxID=1917215 RepID=UPI000CAA68A3|nr:VOC family protein [Ferrovibrio sp.]PJI40889.1 MAG: glyoxalase [Ferrovibrio sp.]
MPNIPRFHLAFPVRDIDEARRFYADIMGCNEGRSGEHWVDFDFFGHQIVAHVSETPADQTQSEVDGEGIPLRHFGVILTPEDWEALTVRLKAANVEFVIEPQVRFKGQIGEQASCLFLDPSGNALELKAFSDESTIFLS